jgi:hypothetical protein
LTDPQLFPEPYRLKTTFGSVHLKTNPNTNTTFNALLTTASADRQDSANERRKSNPSGPFEMIRRGSGSGFPSIFNSMEIPEMRGDACDHNVSLEDGHGPGSGLAQQQIRPSTRTSEEELDEEQLDLYVNEILGGVADMEEMGS